MINSRAAVATQAGKPLSIETIQVDGPREGEVLVEIKATGICHTDEFTLSGADPEGIFPAVLGHEGAGVVVECGPGVKSLKPGDHVIPLYTPECIGNVEVMRQALECCHKGWGTSIIIGVPPAGAEISTRPFQLVTGRNWRGTAFGGAKGRTDVPKIVDWYMDGKIDIDSLITHKMPLEDINKGFDLMHAGESIRSVVEF